MKDEEKSKAQLINELTGLREWVAELEKDKFEQNLLEEALRESEQKYHSIFENAPVGIFRSTTLGKLIEVNPEAARILGYDSPEEIIAVTNRTSTGETLYVDPESRAKILERALASEGEWVEAVAPLIPAHGIRTNPIDLTGDATAQMFADVIKATRAHYDTLGVIFDDPIVNASQAVTPGANELVVYLAWAEVERQAA